MVAENLPLYKYQMISEYVNDICKSLIARIADEQNIETFSVYPLARTESSSSARRLAFPRLRKYRLKQTVQRFRRSVFVRNDRDERIQSLQFSLDELM